MSRFQNTPFGGCTGCAGGVRWEHTAASDIAKGGASLDFQLAAGNLQSATTRRLEDEKVLLNAARTRITDAERATDGASVSGYQAVMPVAAAMALASAVSKDHYPEGARISGSY